MIFRQHCNPLETEPLSEEQMDTDASYMHTISDVPRGGCGLFKPPPPPEIAKALQNCAKLNPIVKTVKNC